MTYVKAPSVKTGTDAVRVRSSLMPKEPFRPPRPEPAEPDTSPVKDPQPYKDPVQPPPGDPQEDRPLHDPTPPGQDQPRMDNLTKTNRR